MSPTVLRTVTPVGVSGPSQPLARFRDVPAFILLGDPGAGKTTEFKEAAASEDAVYVTARKFARADVARRPEWRNTTLFIDGLDELRSGNGDPRQPLDAVLARLESLGWPRVRISCRSSTWLGKNDRHEIESEADYGNLVLLLLDPLTEDDAGRILASRKIANYEAVLASARDRGLHGLLGNPLTLNLLVEATSADFAHPASRRETFARACCQLVVEHNGRHVAADDSAPHTPDDTIAAAGHLALFFLFSGAECIARSSGLDGNHDAHLYVRDIPTGGFGPDDRSNLDFRVVTRALGTKLFATHDSAEAFASACTFIPIHRNVAEYLAAQRLHQCIDGGIPLGRVVALLTGGDGVVVPSLRGIAAWLATLNADVRRCLVKQMPLDILTVGDPTEFPPDDIRRLVLSLGRQARNAGFLSARTQRSWAATLVSTETMDLLRRCIDRKEPSDEAHTIMELLLDCLTLHPTPSALFSYPDAIAVVRDERWWFRVRKRALRAAIAMAEQDYCVLPVLRQLLDDVADGRVGDTSQELRGLLAEALYPEHLSVRELSRTLPPTVGPILAWHLRTALLERTPDSAVGNVLDVLYADLGGLADAIGPDAVTELLNRAIQNDGAAVRVERLYDWLSLHPHPISRTSSTVPTWLSRCRDRWNDLLREHVRRLQPYCRSSWRVPVLLFSELSKSEVSHRCLEAAVAVAAEAPEYVRDYLEIALASRSSSLGPHEWLEWATVKVHGQPLLVKHLERMVAEYVDRRQTYADPMPRRDETVERAILRDKAAVLDPDPSPSVLREVAVHYLRIPPHEPLVDWLDNDIQAVDASLRALRELPYEADLPGLPELLRLDQRGQVSPLSYPFLAGLQEVSAQSEVVLAEFNNERLRSALGIYFLALLNDKSLPDWFAILLDARPELVGEVFVKVHTAWIRGRRGHDEHLARLASAEHAAVARLAVPKLLAIFPVRGTKWHVARMRLIVEAAVRHLPGGELLEIIQRRLAFSSMDVAQRAFWLATGLRVRPRDFLGRVIHFLDGGYQAQSRRRTKSCAADIGRAIARPRNVGVAGACALIRVFGKYHSPDWLGRQLLDSNNGGSMLVSDEDEAREQATQLVHRCVDYLSKEPRRSASRSLDLLARDPALALWHGILRRARWHQAERRREMSFRHPSPAEIADVLRGGPPANACDLTEVVADRLEVVARDIRDGNADGWRLFWNEGSGANSAARIQREGWRAKHENSCRDALLILLRPHLTRLGVDVQPEVHYAEDKRADIRVSCSSGTVAIPIEIKKSSHSGLWSAIDTQLVQKYIRDPASGGHGIYLVLWFGDDCVVPGTGRRPKSPTELRNRLQQQLSAQQKRFVRVIVLDVSRPQAVQG